MIVTFRRAWKPAKGSSRSCLTFLSAPHRVAHRLKPGLLLGLDQVLGQPARCLIGLGKFVGECMPIFGLRLAAGLAKRGLRLVKMALLNAESLLLLDQQLEGLEIRKLRAQLLFHERLADVEARLNDRNHPLELVDGGGDRGLFGFFLRLLTGERGDPGAVLCRSRSSLRFRLGPVRGG
jgi:hypothetical protein